MERPSRENTKEQRRLRFIAFIPVFCHKRLRNTFCSIALILFLDISKSWFIGLQRFSNMKFDLRLEF